MLVVGVLAAPGVAGAGDVDDACRANGGSASMCVGTQKAGERVSAECRRLGAAPDEQCVVPIGHRVIRREVDAYESSWTHRALGLQSALGDDVTFNDAPWIGTHNSFNSTTEFPTASHTDSNQQLSLVDQLRIDMRKLEIDVHWTPSPWAGGAPAPVVCHGRGADQLHAGCTTERLFGDTMAPVAAWLRAHPREVLLLYLEDHLGGTAGEDATARVLNDTFGSLIYRPRGGASCTALPLGLTRRDVRHAGAQVVVVSGCGSGAGWRGAVFDWNPAHVETSTHGYGADCSPRDFPRSIYDTRLVRYYEDSTWLSATVDGGPGYYDAGVTAQAAERMTRCGVDLIDFDQILPDDGRLAAVVWAWAREEPRRQGGECAAQGTDGRWRARPCPLLLPAACRRPDGSWTVVPNPVRFALATRACRARAARFAVPRTGYENERLRAARGATAGDVWLGHARIRGRWRALDSR
jgi:hypothetical protein